MQRVFHFLLFFSLLFLPFSAMGAISHTIGASLPLSGKQATEGKAMQAALMLLLNQVNQQGGINGVPLELIVKDDQNDKKRAQQNANDFARDARILAVIGHQFSSVSLAAGPTYHQNQLVHISPSASNPQVTQSSEWVFSMNYQDRQQGESMAVYLKAVRQAKNVAIIHANDAYGQGLLTSFHEKAKRIDLNIQQTLSYQEGQPLKPTFIQQHWSATKKIDAVLLFAHTNAGAQLVKQLRAAGIKAPIMGPDAFAKQQFINAIGPDSTDILVAGPFLYRLASLKAKAFVDAYQQNNGTNPTVWAAFSYDALQLIIQAIKEKGATRTAIRTYLAHLNSDQTGYSGITGKLFFDPAGAMQRQVMVSMIQGHHFIPAFTQIKPVTAPHILNNLLPRLKKKEVVMVDEIPYQVTQVVYAGLDFSRINRVDIIQQNFDIEFFMWFRWVGDVDVENIDFINGIYGIEDKTEVLREDRSGPVNYLCFKIKGTYLTPYDLRNFPFDSQQLPMSMAHKTKDANQLMLVVDQPNLSQAPITAIYPEEWTYLSREDYAGTYAQQSTFGDPNYAGGASKVEFSIAQTNITIQRILFPYFVTLFLPLVIMVLISLFVFFIPLDQFDARLTLVMTALLSILVFHMSQGESLPNVGYLIRADQFFMISYLLMFALICKTIGVNALFKKERLLMAQRIEFGFALIFVPTALLTFLYLSQVLH